MSTRIAVIVACCLVNRVLPAEEQLPTSPPPAVGVANFTPQGLQIRVFETRMVTEKRVRKVPFTATVDGKPVTQYRDDEYVVQRPVTVPVRRVYKAGFFRVYDATGKLILKADLATRLQQTVLLSVDGMPVPEFYRRLYRPETLIVVAPRPTSPPGPSGGTPRSTPAVGLLVPAKPTPKDEDDDKPWSE